LIEAYISRDKEFTGGRFKIREATFLSSFTSIFTSSCPDAFDEKAAELFLNINSDADRPRGRAITGIP
jgi:hypothetical protein